ncbi:MAG TPA: hypothetical protein VF331_24380 [Polyangiales bacterium]
MGLIRNMFGVALLYVAPSGRDTGNNVTMTHERRGAGSERFDFRYGYLSDVPKP